MTLNVLVYMTLNVCELTKAGLQQALHCLAKLAVGERTLTTTQRVS